MRDSFCKNRLWYLVLQIVDIRLRRDLFGASRLMVPSEGTANLEAPNSLIPSEGFSAIFPFAIYQNDICNKITKLQLFSIELLKS